MKCIILVNSLADSFVPVIKFAKHCNTLTNRSSWNGT